MASYNYQLLLEDDIVSFEGNDAKDFKEKTFAINDKSENLDHLDRLDCFCLGGPKDKIISGSKAELEARSLHMSKILSLCIGLIIGMLIQCATMGMDMVMIVQSLEPIDHAVPSDFQLSQKTMYFTLAWSLLTCLMGSSVLILLRALIESFLSAMTSGDTGKKSEEECFIFTFLLYVDAYFSFGAILAITGHWCIQGYYFENDSNVNYDGFYALLMCLVFYILTLLIMRKAVAGHKKYLARKLEKRGDSENACRLTVVVA